MIHIKGITLTGRLVTTPSLYAAPSMPDRIKFTRPLLIGAVARAAATEKVNVGVLQSVQQAMTHLLFPFIDDSVAHFAFSADIEQMTDNTRTAISGWVGAGACHLYMTLLGYVFRSTGRGLSPTGKVFDIAYGGGPLGLTQIVGAEAKGSFQRQADTALIMRVTHAGYDDQVKPHIDHNLNGYDVVHGYAIGTASNLAPQSACMMHVTQTRRPPTSTLPNPSVPSAAGSAGKYLALQNYRSVFALMGAGGILGAIDAALQNGLSPLIPLGPQVFQVMEWRNREYLVFAAQASQRAAVLTAQPQFGIARQSGEAFLMGLNELLHMKAPPFRFPGRIPQVDFNLDREIQFNDGGAQFPDGLAVLGQVPPRLRKGRLVWTLEGGLRPD